MEEGGVPGGHRNGSYLPSCRAVAVAFVLKVGDGSHHPVIDLGQSQSLLWWALDGFGDQVGVGEVAPGVAAGWCLPRGLRCRQAARSQGAGGGRRWVRGERGASAVMAGGGERTVGNGAVTALVLRRRSGAIDSDCRGGCAVLLVILLLGYDIRLGALRFHRAGVRSRQRPGARPGPLLGLKVRVNDHVQVRERVGERSLGHYLRLQTQSGPLLTADKVIREQTESCQSRVPWMRAPVLCCYSTPAKSQQSRNTLRNERLLKVWRNRLRLVVILQTINF